MTYCVWFRLGIQFLTRKNFFFQLSRGLRCSCVQGALQVTAIYFVLSIHVYHANIFNLREIRIANTAIV